MKISSPSGSWQVKFEFCQAMGLNSFEFILEILILCIYFPAREIPGISPKARVLFLPREGRATWGQSGENHIRKQ
jgi:hypothetical protein